MARKKATIADRLLLLVACPISSPEGGGSSIAAKDDHQIILPFNVPIPVSPFAWGDFPSLHLWGFPALLGMNSQNLEECVRGNWTPVPHLELLEFLVYKFLKPV